MVQLAEEEDDQDTRDGTVEELESIRKALGQLEVQTLLAGEYDEREAVVTIRSGAGGVDAADFAEILMRMYLRWAERHGYPTKVLDTSYAEEAGLKSATFEVKAPYAFGTLSVEAGTHRLVRISPFDNQGRYYTIYGFIDEAKNFEPGAEHAVRVIALSRFPERILTPTSEAAIDAFVTSTDVRTGETNIWDHALEELSDGTYGHIFRMRFFVRAGRTYRLEVRRSDAITASAETTVPRLPESIPQLKAIQVSPDSVLTQEVYLPDLASPWEILVIYRVAFPDISFPDILRLVGVRLPYGRSGERTDDGGWRFTINLSEDAPRVRESIARTNGYEGPLDLTAMGLQIKILDTNWDPPEGVFDPEVLAQPGTLSNVENGYGFWGSIGLYQRDWAVSGLTERLGLGQ